MINEEMEQMRAKETAEMNDKANFQREIEEKLQRKMNSVPSNDEENLGIKHR